MLSLSEKRQILCSFPDLHEVQTSNGRYNYELRNLVSRRRNVACEFSTSGNGYVLGTEATEYPIDARGWINVKNLSESEIRHTVRHAINALRTADLRQRYSLLLTDSGLLPLTSRTWRHFEMLHQPPANRNERDSVRQRIQNGVGDANGLYIYVERDGKVLYVGKARPLKNRLWSHYLESFETVRGDTKDNRWHRFFSSHQGTILVYWTELEDESNRRLVESMLTLELNPAFLEFK